MAVIAKSRQAMVLTAPSAFFNCPSMKCQSILGRNKTVTDAEYVAGLFLWPSLETLLNIQIRHSFPLQICISQINDNTRKCLYCMFASMHTFMFVSGTPPIIKTAQTQRKFTPSSPPNAATNQRQTSHDKHLTAHKFSSKPH